MPGSTHGIHLLACPCCLLCRDRMVRDSSAEYDTAVNLVLNGMTTSAAWEAADKPGKDKASALSNIRKRVRLLKCKRKVADEPTETAAATPIVIAVAVADKTPGSSVLRAQARRNSETAAFRMRSDQLDKQASAERRQKRAFIDALKAASTELFQEQQTGGRNGTPALSAEKVAQKHNVNLPDDVQKLKGGRVYNHVRAGLAGLSPLGKGPAPRIPTTAVDVVASHVSMSQINGNELKPRAIRQTIAALVEGTTLEQHLKSKQQRSKFLRRLRQSGLQAVPKVLCDNRRWMFLTYTNVGRYFTGWKYFQLTTGFAEDEPMLLSDGSTAEITVTEYMLRRMSNGDETQHQRLSNCGDK